MANNVQVTQGSGTTFKTTDNAGVHTGHINVDAIVVSDGADVAQGAKADSAATSDTGTFSLIALIKRLLDRNTSFIGPKLDAIVTTITGESIDTVAHDASASGVNPLLQGGFASAAAPTSVSADGDAVQAWYLRNGAQAVTVTAAGALIGGDATNGMDVDVTRMPTDPFGSNADAAATSDAGTFSLIALIKRLLDRNTTFIGPKLDTIVTTIQSESIDTVAHDADASTTNPLLTGGYASAAAPASVTADGDAVQAWYLRNGAAAVQVTAAGALVAGDATNGLDVDVTRVTGGAVAHDAADSGNPIKFGAKAKSALSGVTLVAAEDRSDAFSDLDGALLIRPQGALGDVVSGNASNTDGTSTAVIATGGAGIKQYLTSVILTNTSASNIYVEMKSATTTKATIPVPANSGAVVTFPVPLPPNAANEAWNFDPSAAATTIYCTAVGFKSKI